MATIMSATGEVPYLDVSIGDGDQVLSDAKRLVCQIRNDWNVDHISYKELTGGYTNKLMAFMRDDDVTSMNDVIVVRIYGRQTELMVSREHEIKCQMLFHSIGCAAPVYCHFRNGFIYKYSPGNVLNIDLVHDAKVTRLVTKELARVHSVRPENDKTSGLDHEPRLFKALDNFLNIIPESFTEPDKQAKLEKMKASRKELETEVEYTRNVLLSVKSPVVLCHNDLLFNNILYNKETNKVTFIDFEYGAFNYEGFEIATHFLEYAGMEVVDYSKLPDKAYQMSWLRSYLESYFEFQGKRAEDVSQCDVERLYFQINTFTLGVHLFWGMWALAQSRLSDIDYDYLDYSRIRLSEYYLKKTKLLSLDKIA